MGLPPNLAFQDLVLCLQGLSSNIQISIFNLLDCKMNIDSYCRLCALPKPQLVRIFDEEGHRCNIVANINKCLKIEIYEKDPLPRAVCTECSEKLSSTCTFIDASFKAQETLQSILEGTDLLKRENCYTSEDSLGDGSKHSSDSLILAFEQKNDGAGKDLISIDDVDSCLIEEYVENLNLRNNLSQVGCPEEDVSSKEFPRAFPFFTNSPIEDRIDSTGSSSNTESQHFQEVSQFKEGTLHDCFPKGTIRINKNVFEKGKGESSESTLQVIKVEHKEFDMMEREEKSGDSGVQLMDNEEKFAECISNETQSSGKEHNVKKSVEAEAMSFNDIMWPCGQCDKLFAKFNDRQLHYSSSHEGPVIYVCPMCSKKFSKSTSFNAHLKKHKPTLDCSPLRPSQNKLSCDECKEKFSNKKLLLAHMAVHSDLRSHPCKDCGKTFRHQGLLELHARSHLPADLKNKFQCDLCDKRFSTKPNLITHRRIHLGVKNYTCDQCGKGFIQKGNLDTHLLTHSSDKPFSCEMCEKSFKTMLQLRKHHSVHTGDKPHQCDVCGRMFRERGTLREHYRIHTGAMPFSCEFCGKTFRFKGILTTHRRQHTGEKPYSCQECQHHFTNWPNYNKHMKRRHGVNTSKTSRVKLDPSGASSDEPAKTTLSDFLDFQPVLEDQEPYDQLPIIDGLSDQDIILSTVYNTTSSLPPNNVNTFHPFASNSPLINFYNLSHLPAPSSLDIMSFSPSLVDITSSPQHS
ncbi:uncharacterized protein [Bemisia tabaci]|uniref:uncharacterized protein isoform X3 n=1 Tax=Bemisia tabaci TaxID=7038 RepID=UPI003B288D5C